MLEVEGDFYIVTKEGIGKNGENKDKHFIFDSQKEAFKKFKPLKKAQVKNNESIKKKRKILETQFEKLHKDNKDVSKLEKRDSELESQKYEVNFWTVNLSEHKLIEINWKEIALQYL